MKDGVKKERKMMAALTVKRLCRHDILQARDKLVVEKMQGSMMDHWR